MQGTISINRALPVINGFVVVPDAGYAGGKRNQVIPSEALAAIAGSYEQPQGSTHLDPIMVTMPPQRPFDHQPDYWAQLRAIS